MLCTFLRAVQYTEKLHRSSGKRLFLPHLVLSKACLKTKPSLRWGLPGQEKTVRPGRVLGAPQKTLWTQGQSPRGAEEDSSKQVSVRSQRGEPAIPTAQKGKEDSPVEISHQRQALPRPFARVRAVEQQFVKIKR